MLNNAQSRWLSNKRVISRVLSATFFALMLSNGGAAETDFSAPAAVHHIIEISGFKFKPNRLEVAVGDMITWINKDIVTHNIAINDGAKVLSPTLHKGEQFTLQAKSTLPYICGLHPGMKGDIIVLEPSAHQQVTPCKTPSRLMGFGDVQDAQVQCHITAFLALESHSARCL